MARRTTTPAGRLSVVENNRIQVLKWRIEQRELMALHTGQEDDAARLIFDEAAEHSTLVERELVILHTNVAQEHDVVFGKRFQCAGELFDVVLVAATTLIE